MTGYFEQFAASVGSIVVSEIGDKTFFIAAIMAMRYDRLYSFIGAISALVVMTILSCAFGYVIPQLIPKKWTIFLSMILFFFFGLKMIYEAYKNEEHAEEEKNEVEMRISALESGLLKKNADGTEVQASSENNGMNNEGLTEENNPLNSPQRKRRKESLLFTPRFILGQSFTLTFLAEWGDRSQYTTIALSASFNAIMICLGAILGHAFCTGLAVLSGKYLSEKISERVVNLIGGVLFVIFGVVALVNFFQCCDPEEGETPASRILL